MSPSRSRQFILVLAAFVVAAGSLSIPGSALADTALFRVERKFYGAALPPVTTPGGAGLYEVYVEPYVSLDKNGNYNYNPATAKVQPGNPIGGAFTLPTGFIDFIGTYTLTAKTAFPGYTSVSGLNYYNGPGYFQPSFGATAPTRVVFPTTGNNPDPNYGTGQPNLPTTGGGLCLDGSPPPTGAPSGGGCGTTTFSGRYDFYRAGSINVTPGPRRFGGTFQMFYRPESFWYQYIFVNDPVFFKAYGSFRCQNPPGVTCYAGSVSNIGDITSSGMVTRFLLNNKGTGTGNRKQDNTAKATTPATPNGTFPTYGGQGTPTGSGPASYIVAKNYYLHLIHPWTTGFASAYNPLETSPTPITPQLQGFDKSFGGIDYTVTRTYWSLNYNTTNQTVNTITTTYKQYLKGVGRVVSMVRPRLKHVYEKPLDPSADPITSNFQAARLYTMKVFFLPEPAGMLLLGAGIAIVLGLSRMRRR
jgi:hypothetical protein